MNFFPIILLPLVMLLKHPKTDVHCKNSVPFIYMHIENDPMSEKQPC